MVETLYKNRPIYSGQRITEKVMGEAGMEVTLEILVDSPDSLSFRVGDDKFKTVPIVHVDKYAYLRMFLRQEDYWDPQAVELRMRC